MRICLQRMRKEGNIPSTYSTIRVSSGTLLKTRISLHAGTVISVNILIPEIRGVVRTPCPKFGIIIIDRKCVTAMEKHSRAETISKQTVYSQLKKKNLVEKLRL